MRPALRGVLAGTLTFLCGFAVLATTWRLGAWRTDVPGLWDYRSATFGDGALLPALVALLEAAGAALPPAGPADGRVVGLAALAGAAAGAGVQLVRLLDPRPTLNWTAPAPGVLNAAGIYHAAFLVAAGGLLCAAAVRVLVRSRALRVRDPARIAALARSPWAALALACAVGFVGLVAQDAVRLEGLHGPGHAAGGWLSGATMTAAAAVAVMLFAVLAAASVGRDGVRQGWRTWLVGLALAGVGLLVTWSASRGHR